MSVGVHLFFRGRRVLGGCVGDVKFDVGHCGKRDRTHLVLALGN